MENPNFLKKKYNLQNSPEVESSIVRSEKLKGEKISQKPNERIQNYLNRFKEIFEREDETERQRGIEVLKKVFHRKFIIKPEDVPETYFMGYKRLAREEGNQEVHISSEQKEFLTNIVISDQENALDNWMDYLSSTETNYPLWLKYWAMRGILDMGPYDKEKKAFTTRAENTIRPLHDLNPEALSYVLSAMEKKYEKHGTRHPDAEFEKILQSENFTKLYASAMGKVTPESKGLLENISGKWVKYSKGSDPTHIIESIRGRNTGWMTGVSNIEGRIKDSDLYVYYSLDEHNEPKVPRVMINMEDDKIGEVIGIAHGNNLDANIITVVKEKLSDFSNAGTFENKLVQIDTLNVIENKVKKNDKLTKDDLIFLYEINSRIESFGHEQDPRIQEIRSERNPKEDAPIIFECEPENIAWKPEDVRENTKAYIGPLFENIFQTNIKYIFTSFPERNIRKIHTTIGGKNKMELGLELNKENIKMSKTANEMLLNNDFRTLKNIEKIDLVVLTVNNLGFPKGATKDEIYKKAEELGLELCPAETGPYVRLLYNGASWSWILVGMNEINDNKNEPHIFSMDCDDEGLWLSSCNVKSSRIFDASSFFVFRLLKKEY